MSKDKNDGTVASYGLGIEYDAGTPDKWVLRGDLARTEVDDDGDAVNMATASVVRKF
jgi:hypothetical protein